jgi:broad specificity phosphatase PhoE
LVSRVTPPFASQSAFAHQLTIYLIRHGETDWTAADRHNGRTDIPLSTRGRRQAKALKKLLCKIHFDRIYCSPSQRAVQTAAIALPPGAVTLCDELLEWDYGMLEGKTVSEIRKTIPEWTPWTHGFARGETLAQLQLRVRRFAKKITRAPGVVGIVSHGHTLRVFSALWLGLSISLASRLRMAPGSISILDWEYNLPAIRQWNLQPDAHW